jgi:hypothetical protein
MTKKRGGRRRKKAERESAFTPAMRELKQSLKAVKWRRILLVTVSFAVIFSVYALCMINGIGVVMWIYYAALILLALAFLFLNFYGVVHFSKKSVAVPNTKFKKKAKALLYFIIPLLLTFSVEIINTFYLEPLGLDFF